MAYKIEAIEGIGPSYASRLAGVNIRTTDDFLKLCGDARGREHVSTRTGLSESQLLAWANLADLMRISGIGPQYAELLEVSGVDTVKELRNRNAENLAVKMEQVNASRKLTKNLPGVGMIRSWIKEAWEIEPSISH